MSTPIDTTRRTLLPGDTVVPLSEILARLESQVSPDVIDNLLRDVLSNRLPEVRPGQLITADLMNQVLFRLASLEVRVARLEQGGGGVASEPVPVITDWSPLEPHLRERLTVNGRNFPAAPGPGSVDFEGVFITHFISASPNRLEFEVTPGISGTLPREVTMTIRNGQRSGTARVRVQPEVIVPRGEMFVTDVTPNLGTIVVGTAYTYVFDLDSQTIPDETYRLEALFTDAAGTATADDWHRNTTLPSNAGGIRCGPTRKERVNVVVRVPTGAQSVNFALRAVSLNNPSGLTRTSGVIAIRVGSTADVNDPRTTLSIDILGPLASARNATIDGQQGIEVAYGATENISVTARFQQAGAYTYSAEIESPDEAIWTPTRPVPVPPQSNEVAGGEENIAFALTLRMAAPASGGLHPEKRFLIVRAKRTNTDSVGVFTSFLRFPIQGFVRT
jgi:hypothetical protein